MKISIPSGRYVLAVSGGVDSMVLLDLLAKKPGIDLIAAHFNHGIRPQSGDDEDFVRQKAHSLGLSFVSGEGNLGKDASEDAARRARYKFLEEIRREHRAQAIVTAHHQDDLIETAFINIIRGTGPRGLAAIALNEKIIRPLLNHPKAEIIKYAKAKNLSWHEDETNRDDKYLRNRIRKLLGSLTAGQRRAVLENITKVTRTEQQAAPLIANLSQLVMNNSSIDRGVFTRLPVNLGNELVVYWLRQKQVPEIDSKTVNRLNTAIRTARAGTTHPVRSDLLMEISQKTARFHPVK